MRSDVQHTGVPRPAHHVNASKKEKVVPAKPQVVMHVMAYLQRQSAAMITGLSLYHAPATNEPFLKVSGDRTPIHTNPYFAPGYN